MSAAAIVDQGLVDLTDLADSWRLGVPQRVGTSTGESPNTREAIRDSVPDGPHALFPAFRWDPGWGLPIKRLLNWGGTRRGDEGYVRSDQRVTPVRVFHGEAPTTHVNIQESKMPGGLMAVGPWWESHIYGDDLTSPVEF